VKRFDAMAVGSVASQLNASAQRDRVAELLDLSGDTGDRLAQDVTRVCIGFGLAIAVVLGVWFGKTKFKAPSEFSDNLDMCLFYAAWYGMPIAGFAYVATTAVAEYQKMVVRSEFNGRRVKSNSNGMLANLRTLADALDKMVVGSGGGGVNKKVGDVASISYSDKAAVYTALANIVAEGDQCNYVSLTGPASAPYPLASVVTNLVILAGAVFAFAILVEKMQPVEMIMSIKHCVRVIMNPEQAEMMKEDEKTRMIEELQQHVNAMATVNKTMRLVLAVSATVATIVFVGTVVGASPKTYKDTLYAARTGDNAQADSKCSK
jgi:hypothetical protein